ncbi:MAG: hypothetical protein JXD18_15570, partial [Anaerolineae bacterium]|nr:hypothetical protein [Anaerolineae bacterium]
ARAFISDDPLREMGPDYAIFYNVFGRLSTGAFVPVYPPEMDATVRALMGEWGLHEIVYCPP